METVPQLVEKQNDAVKNRDAAQAAIDELIKRSSKLHKGNFGLQLLTPEEIGILLKAKHRLQTEKEAHDFIAFMIPVIYC